MNRASFDTLTLQNFLSHRDSHLVLRDRGLVLLVGQTEGTSASDSNGGGKTALVPDGLCFAGWGRTLRGVHDARVVTRGETRGKTVLQGRDAAGAPFVLTRTFGTGGTVTLRVGAETIRGKHECAGVFQTILGGQDFDAYVATHILGKGNAEFFGQLGDAARKNIFDTLIQSTDIQTFLARAKRHRETARATLDTATTELAAATATRDLAARTAATWQARAEASAAAHAQYATECARLDAAVAAADAACPPAPDPQQIARVAQRVNELDALTTLARAQHQALLDDADDVVRARQALTEAHARLADVQAHAAAPADLLAERDAAIVARDDLRAQCQSLRGALSGDDRVVADLTARRASWEGRIDTTCPTCERPIAPTDTAPFLRAIDDELATANARRSATARALDESEAGLQAAEQRVAAAALSVDNAMQAHQRGIEQARSDVVSADIRLAAARQAASEAANAAAATLAACVQQSDAARAEKRALEVAGDAYRRGRDAVHAVQERRRALTPPADDVATIATAVADATAAVEEQTAAVARWQQRVADGRVVCEVIEHALRAFGPTGIRVDRLRLVLPTLNYYAQQIAEELTGGDMTVAFSAETTLLSGEKRDRFAIEVDVPGGATDYALCSDGQRRRVDVITTLSLARLAGETLTVQPDLLILDEAFDGLDRTGTEHAIRVLHGLPHASIFCTTHTAALAAQFDRVITVRRDPLTGSVVDDPTAPPTERAA